jgi:hypothetical protein
LSTEPETQIEQTEVFKFVTVQVAQLAPQELVVLRQVLLERTSPTAQEVHEEGFDSLHVAQVELQG